MSKSKESDFVTTDSKRLTYRQWNPEQEADRVILIVHGMAEHSARYEYVAHSFNENNSIVCSYDQRGHGKSVDEGEMHGFISSKNGWETLVRDLDEIIVHVKELNPKKSLFIIGHSMGSVVLMSHLEKFGEVAEGYVFSSIPFKQNLLSDIGMAFSNAQSFFTKKSSKGVVQNAISFGAFNKKFKPVRTPFDWLSKDENEVDKYMNDPDCGRVFTTQFFYDLASGVKNIYLADNLKRLPQDTDVYFIFGADDPVAGGEEKINETLKIFKSNLDNVSYQIYEKGRHELMNETNKDEVIADIFKWIKRSE